MTSIDLLVSIALTAWAQVAPATPPRPAAPDAETIVATIEGKKVTAGELQSIVRSLGPAAQQNFTKDPEGFLNQLGMMKRMADMAEKAHLDRQSPYKEQLDFNRMLVLYTAQATAAQGAIIVTAEEQMKFYESNKDRYAQAKVKVIYTSFSANPSPQTDPKAKKILTESEARAESEKLLARIRSGKDFVKLVRENSDDADSAAKDGDFGVILRSDKIPDAIKSAVFALKPGEVSEPVKQPNGYYLFRLEDLTSKPYAEVKDDIYTEIQLGRLNDWMAATQKSVQVKIENPDFFSGLKNPPAAVPK